MTATSTALTGAHLPAIGGHERAEIGQRLQETTVELIDLSLLGKQLHWNLADPMFIPIHRFIDELVDSWRDLSDTTAERAVMLGFAPDGQAATVAAGSPIEPVEPEPLSAAAVIRYLVRAVAEVAERIRDRSDRIGEIDSISEDVLIGVVRRLEEQLWMLRAQLPVGR